MTSSMRAVSRTFARCPRPLADPACHDGDLRGCPDVASRSGQASRSRPERRPRVGSWTNPTYALPCTTSSNGGSARGSGLGIDCASRRRPRPSPLAPVGGPGERPGSARPPPVRQRDRLPLWREKTDLGSAKFAVDQASDPTRSEKTTKSEAMADKVRIEHSRSSPGRRVARGQSSRHRGDRRHGQRYALRRPEPLPAPRSLLDSGARREAPPTARCSVSLVITQLFDSSTGANLTGRRGSRA